MSDGKQIHQYPAIFWIGGGTIEGMLEMPEDPRGVVILASASASRRNRLSTRQIVNQLHDMRLATFAVDLLTEDEAQIDSRTEHYRENVPLLARRIVTVTDWLRTAGPAQMLPTGYLVSGMVTSAAFLAAERLGGRIDAIVSFSGVPDLAMPLFAKLPIPTLLMVEEDSVLLIGRNREAYRNLSGPRDLILLSEDRDLRAVAQLAGDWFERHFHPREADAKGAVEDQMQHLESAEGNEVLGYMGIAHEEHTGEKVTA